jgi:nucleoside-diphosphate-sugar epimerase
MDDGRPFIMLEEARAAWRWTRGYVDNVADAIASAVMDERAAARIYNVGERDALTEAEWVQAVGRAAGWKGEVIAVPGDLLPGGMASGFNLEHHLAVDTSRIREELGYGEQVARDEALKRAVEWERTHPPEEVDPRQFDYAAEEAVLERLQKTP